MQKTELTVNIGTLCDGTGVSHDIKRLPHLLIAGGGNDEARAFLTRMLLDAARNVSPNTLRVLAIGLGSEINSLPHLLTPVIEEEKEAERALLWLTGEVDRRYGLFEAAGVRSIDAYNEKADGLFVIIAAIGDARALTKKARGCVASLAAKARAAGIYVLLSSDKADTRSIDAIIRVNVPSRIALKTETSAQSRAILDTAGAEGLEAGEILFRPVGTTVPQVLNYQAPTDDASKSLVNEIASRYPRAEYVAISSAKEEAPDLLKGALEAALEYGGISTALLQRTLHIGYKKASALVEKMENAGYIGEYRGSAPRKVLLTAEELEGLIKER